MRAMLSRRPCVPCGADTIHDKLGCIHCRTPQQEFTSFYQKAATARRRKYLALKSKYGAAFDPVVGRLAATKDIATTCAAQNAESRANFGARKDPYPTRTDAKFGRNRERKTI